MSEEKSGITRDIEELVNKTIEANKFFISEGSNILRHFTTQNAGKNSGKFIQPDVLTNAFNAYLKLNLQHAKNLIDLSVGLIKQTVAPKDEPVPEENETTVAEPAFVLQADVIAGNKALLQFVLDNVKEEAVICRLVNTDYISQAGEQIKLTTSFEPQAFELKPGAAQAVKIEIATVKECLPGIYTSNVQVQGFEPSFFSIQLTIKENQQQQKGNGRKKTK